MTIPTKTFLFACLLLLPMAALAQPAPAPTGGRPPQRPAPGPGNPPPPDSSFFYAQAMRAMDEKASLLLDQGKTAQAIQALQEVYSLEVPKESPFYEMKVRVIGRLAKAYAESGRKAEALDTLKKLLAEVPPGTPAEAAAWLEAGGVYKQAGMPDDALKAFDRSIELSKKLAKSGRAPPPPPGGPGGPRSGPGDRP